MGARAALLPRAGERLTAAPGPRRRVLVGLGALGVVAVAAVAVVTATGVLGGGTPSVALGAPHFVEETSTAGVDHTYAGPQTYATGGGLATLDCDGDGRPDLYLAGGTNPAALYRNESPAGGPLRFTRVASPVTDLTGVVGAYALDIDGDGQPDLAVLRVGGLEILRGLGGCRFERANEALGLVSPDGLVSAFSATWEPGEVLPTLAVGRYLKLDATGATTLDCDTSVLFRPVHRGRTYGPAISLAPGFCTLSVLFSDWDRSGRRDLRVSNDANYYDPKVGSEQLWRVAPGEAPRLYTADDGFRPLQVEGMGIASQDLTGDGYPEIFLTSQADQHLLTLTAGPAQPAYREIAGKAGLAALARPFTGGDVYPSTAWHPEFRDVNDDGFVDLFVSKGNVNAQPGFATKDPSDLLLGSPAGTFSEVADAAGILTFDRSRGASMADLDLDGLPDLVVVAYGAPVRLWRNVGAGSGTTATPMGHWLELRLVSGGADRDAIGALIEVKTGDLVQRRELVVGGGHASGELGWTHLGTGPATRAQVRVIWPDGTTGPWATVDTDRFLEITHGVAGSPDDQPRVWTPRF